MCTKMSLSCTRYKSEQFFMPSISGADGNQRRITKIIEIVTFFSPRESFGVRLVVQYSALYTCTLMTSTQVGSLVINNSQSCVAQQDPR